VQILAPRIRLETTPSGLRLRTALDRKKPVQDQLRLCPFYPSAQAALGDTVTGTEMIPLESDDQGESAIADELQKLEDQATKCEKHQSRVRKLCGSLHWLIGFPAVVSAPTA
jgi:hypothetical protein